MKANKLSSKAHALIKSAASAAVLPLLFTYIMIAKPDYRIMNAMAHVVVPTANLVGDIITWPVRAIGRAATNMRELASIRAENEELRARLNAALLNQNECRIAIDENQKLTRELDLINARPTASIIADVIHDNTALNHETFMINRGTDHGIENGMIVITTDGFLGGIITDAGNRFSRVRALTDSKSNIAVRVAGTEIYGFMIGNGTNRPTIGLFSDPEFKPAPNQRIVTSNISGVLPAGVIVGDMINETDVRVHAPSQISRVMVLRFDDANKYK